MYTASCRYTTWECSCAAVQVFHYFESVGRCGWLWMPRGRESRSGRGMTYSALTLGGEWFLQAGKQPRDPPWAYAPAPPTGRLADHVYKPFIIISNKYSLGRVVPQIRQGIIISLVQYSAYRPRYTPRMLPAGAPCCLRACQMGLPVTRFNLCSMTQLLSGVNIAPFSSQPRTSLQADYSVGS